MAKAKTSSKTVKSSKPVGFIAEGFEVPEGAEGKVFFTQVYQEQGVDGDGLLEIKNIKNPGVTDPQQWRIFCRSWKASGAAKIITLYCPPGVPTFEELDREEKLKELKELKRIASQNSIDAKIKQLESQLSQ